MLGAAPSGLLRVNRGADANKLDDLLTFMSNAILKSGKDIFGMGSETFKIHCTRVEWQEKALNARYREAVSHWNIAGRPGSGPLEELKGRARAAFRHEMNFFREN